MLVGDVLGVRAPTNGFELEVDYEDRDVVVAFLKEIGKERRRKKRRR